MEREQVNWIFQRLQFMLEQMNTSCHSLHLDTKTPYSNLLNAEHHSYYSYCTLCSQLLYVSTSKLGLLT